MEPQAFTFASSPFVPVAIGFLAWVPATSSLHLGWSGLVWFSQDQSRSQPNPGLMGFLDAGLHAAPHGHLSVDRITWFNVFSNAAPLYMAGLAFTAYGIHWFAMAHRRYIDSSAQLDGWMALAFLFLSILGVDVFRRSGDIPVMIILVGLTLIYATEIPTRLLSWNPGGRVIGLFQFITGLAHVLHVCHDRKPCVGR